MSGPAASRVDLRGTVAGGDTLAPARSWLAEGRAVVHPTETGYAVSGVLDSWGDRTAASLDPGSPGAVHLLVSGREAVEGLGWSDAARSLADIFWPGALTFLLDDPSGRWGRGRAAAPAAVRWSPHPTVAGLLEAWGAPLVSVALRRPDGGPVRSADEVEGAVGLEAAAPLLVLDGGRVESPAPATVVDATRGEPRVVWEGSVPLNRMRCALPALEASLG